MTDNNMPWYKWHPTKCLSSIRWLSLSLEEEGLYRRLYDFASLSQPSDKRGWLYTDGVPTSRSDLRVASRLHASKFRVNFELLLKKKLITIDNNGAYGFPSFAKHQRKANLRPRPPKQAGPNVGQNGGKVGLQSKEEELRRKNKEEEGELNATPQPINPDLEFYKTAFINKTKWRGKAEWFYEHFGALAETEIDISKAIEKHAIPGMSPNEFRIAVLKASAKPKYRNLNEGKT